jgi:hypothetical protein
MKKTLMLALSAICLTFSATAQKSPDVSTTGTINSANITITYGSPLVKGRQIWGGLVPYDKVWRAGANFATVIQTDKDLKVEGKPLPAGKYSIYAIPGEKEWTIIFNSVTGQWGITRQGETTRDPAKDVLTVVVKPKKSASMYESMKYEITPKGISLIWENLEVPIKVQ